MSTRPPRPTTQSRQDPSPHSPPAPAVPPTRPAISETALREVTPADLARLQHLSGYPMVSVLMPTTPGARLGPEDQANLAALAERAQRRLAAELPGAQVDELLDPLRVLSAQVIDSPAGPGLVLYAGAGIVEAYRLAISPAPRVVIDPSFATRDLARTVAENPPYRLLTLASGSARLYIGTGAQLHERVTSEFPLGEPATDSPADRRGHLHQGEPTHRGAHRWDRFLRQVDEALTADQRTRSLPLILAAAEPLASRYQRRTSHHIAGTIAGNHQRTPAVRLAELARPVIELHLAQQRQEALDGLERAVDQRRAATGIHQVWQAASDGRIAVLLVDPAYTYPALAAPDGRSLTRSRDPEHPDVLDDAVDEIIELVARRGGRVCFTTHDGTGHQIAAVLETR